MSTLEQAVAISTAYVNQARRNFGIEEINELPDSMPGNASDCLFHRALGPLGVQSVGAAGEINFASERVARTVGALWNAAVEGHVVHAPAEFGQVIGAFDDQQLKHYNTSKPLHF